MRSTLFSAGIVA